MPFEQFISLVEVDQSINGFHAQIAAHEKKIAAWQQELQVQQSNVERVKARYDQNKKEVDAKELEMKSLDQQEADKKARLEQVANHKEYQSIKAEVDQLKKSQHALEDTLIGAWNQLEQSKKEWEAQAAVFGQRQQELQASSQQEKDAIDALKKQIEQFMSVRTEKEKQVPAEWLQKYAIMRTRVKDPVVPVLDGSCSACFYKISAQDMNDLKHRKLVQCKDCYRLLYMSEAQGH